MHAPCGSKARITSLRLGYIRGEKVEEVKVKGSLVKVSQMFDMLVCWFVGVRLEQVQHRIELHLVSR